MKKFKRQNLIIQHIKGKHSYDEDFFRCMYMSKSIYANIWGNCPKRIAMVGLGRILVGETRNYLGRINTSIEVRYDKASQFSFNLRPLLEA